MIDISKHPTLPLKRKVVVIKKTELNGYIEMVCKVLYYEDISWKDVKNNNIKKEVRLRADNSIKVDSNTWSYVVYDSNWNTITPQENIMWEYDFIRNQKKMSIAEFEEFAIKRADTEQNRFD